MSQKKKIVVDLFFDVISPYSYVTYATLTKYQKIWKSMDLKLKPVFLAGIMGQTGNKPPATVPAKGKYMGKDLKRISEYFDVEYKMPKNAHEVMFVKGTVSAQRLLTSVAKKHPSYLQPLADELYSRFWWKHLDVVEESSLKQACVDAKIPNELIEGLIESIKSPDVKDLLKQNTQHAIEQGCFGLPFYLVHLPNGKTEPMFGSDRLFLLADYLDEKWPGPWKKVAKL